MAKSSVAHKGCNKKMENTIPPPPPPTGSTSAQENATGRIPCEQPCQTPTSHLLL